MAKEKDQTEQSGQFELDEILAEFGNESRDLPSETDREAGDFGVPEDGPDLIPVPERVREPEPQPAPYEQVTVEGPYLPSLYDDESEEETEEPTRRIDLTSEQEGRSDDRDDWADNTIPFPVQAVQEAAEPEAEPKPRKGVRRSRGKRLKGAEPAHGEARSEPQAKTRAADVLEFPSPEPANPVMAGLDGLRRMADDFAAHMYQEEGPKAARARRAEKLIPGVDEEETPKKVRERKPRRTAPPPPDLSPAELSKRYVKGLKGLRARTTLVFFLAFALLYMTLAAPLALPLSNILTKDLTLLSYTMASLQIIALVLGYDAVLQALTSPFRGFGMGLDTLAVLANAAVLADALTLPLLPVEGVTRLPYCGVAALTLAFVLLGDLQKRRGQRLSARTAAAASAPYLVTRDEGKWNGKDTYTKWSGPMAGFGSQLQSPDGAQRIFRLMVPLLLLASVVFALISSVGHGRPNSFFWCLASILTAAAPLSATLCFGSPWRSLATRLSQSGAAIAGWQGVTNTTGTANLLLTDSDLFPHGSVSLNGIKVFGDFPIDEVVADAATLIRDAGSGLERLFYDQVRAYGTVYRRGENFTAYEGGGVSEIIRGEQVLVGSAAFMVLMDVPMPAGLKVKNAVFCAIDGELAGIFPLDYQLPGTVAPAIDSLIRNKITPVLATRDFNLIPSMLRQRFKLPVDRMEYPPVERRRELSEAEQDHSDTLTAVLCREGLGPYAEAVVGARRLRTAVRLSASVACLGSAVGALLCFYLTFVSAYASLTPLNLLIFLILWFVPIPLISAWVDKYE